MPTLPTVTPTASAATARILLPRAAIPLTLLHIQTSLAAWHSAVPATCAGLTAIVCHWFRCCIEPDSSDGICLRQADTGWDLSPSTQLQCTERFLPAMSAATVTLSAVSAFECTGCLQVMDMSQTAVTAYA